MNFTGDIILDCVLTLTQPGKITH